MSSCMEIKEIIIGAIFGTVAIGGIYVIYTVLKPRKQRDSLEDFARSFNSPHVRMANLRKR
jgi:hypothetical protein